MGDQVGVQVTLTNTKKVVDMCIVGLDVAILQEDNAVIICNFFHDSVFIKKKINNVNCISPISHTKIGTICGDNNAIIYDITDLENPMFNKLISIPNSPYCAKFNTQNIPYYPKYFMDRFIAFVMSLRHGCNIKLPKYLYFMIANYLR